MQVGELFVRAARDLPGWTLLVRNDNERGFFANAVSPNHKQYVGVESGKVTHKSVGMTFPTYAATPELALGGAIASAMILAGPTGQPQGTI